MINHEGLVMVKCRYSNNTGSNCLLPRSICNELFKDSDTVHCNRFFVKWTSLIINNKYLEEL